MFTAVPGKNKPSIKLYIQLSERSNGEELINEMGVRCQVVIDAEDRIAD